MRSSVTKENLIRKGLSVQRIKMTMKSFRLYLLYVHQEKASLLCRRSINGPVEELEN